MTPTIEEISRAFIDGFVTLDDEEQRLTRVLYRLLATGRPAPPDAIAGEAGWPVVEVVQRLDAWPAVFRNTDGAVVGFWGLAAEEVSEHRLEIEGVGTAWAWCAYDTLFIPPLLGVPARVTSPCPTTRETIRLTVSRDGVEDLEPATAVSSMLTPDMPFGDDVVQTLCHYVHFFASPDAAERWTGNHPGTFQLSVADAFEVARRANAGVFPAIVESTP